MDLDLARGLCGRDRLRMHQYPLRTEIKRRHGGGSGDDQFCLAVKTAVTVDIGRSGQYVIAGAVVDRHEQVVVGSEPHLAGDFEDERRSTAAVRPYVPSVEENIGDALCPVEFDEQPPPGPCGRDMQRVEITPRRLDEMTGREIRVPAVGQCDRAGIVRTFLGLIVEVPALVERDHLAGLYRDAADQSRQEKKISFHFFRFSLKIVPLMRTIQDKDTNKRGQNANLFVFCRAGVFSTKSKIRISESKSKRRFE